jgi:flagellin
MAVADFSRINSNIGALNSLNSLNNVNKQLGMHQMRLATGKRINSAADDPAGLTIATKFRSRNENLKTAMDNIGDAQNLLSVAEGGLSKVQDILVTMRKKAESAASDTLGTDERTAIGEQLAQFAREIDDIVDQTTWNGNKLLDGLSASNFTGQKITLQTGAEANETTVLDAADGFGSVSVKSNGALSNLASISNSSVAAFDTFGVSGGTTLSGGDITLVDGGNTLTAGLNELSTGTYTIRLNVTTDSDAAGGTVSLLNSNGEAVNIDDGAGNQAMSQVFSTLSAAAPLSIDFGNGLSFSLDTESITATGTATFTVDYTQEGDYTVSVGNNTDATAYMGHVDDAIETISDRLQTLGSLSSRLTFKEENLAGAQINTEAAYNRIMNADMAVSQMEATKFQILQQTATTMLAQANQAPQGLLSLFR